MKKSWLGATSCGLFLITAALADGAASGRLSSRDFDQAYPGTKVFATDARSSSTYGRGYGTEEAIGAPKVFPRLGDNRGAWACKNKRSHGEWIELTFPATETSTVLIYETCDPGAVRRVLVNGEEVYTSSEKPGKFTRSQVLWVRLDPPRSVTTVRVELDPSLVPGWPQIDAVGLVPATGEAAPTSGRDAAEVDPDAELNFDGLDNTNRERVEKALHEVEALTQRLAEERTETILVLDGRDLKTIHDDLPRSARYWLGNATPGDHPAVAIVAARIDRAERALAEAKQAWQARLAELGDVDARCTEELAWVRARYQADRTQSKLLPPAPEGLDPAAARAWAPQLAAGIKDLEQRLAYLQQVQRLDPRFQIKGRSDHTEFLNQFRRALGEIESTLRQATWAVDAELEASAEVLATFDPTKLTVADVRRAAFARESVAALRPLDRVQERLAFAQAFYEGFEPRPAQVAEAAGRLASLTQAVETRVTQQIASERLTDATAQDPALLAQTKQLLGAAPLRVALSEPAERHQGTWTEKDLISETRHGDTLERKFRVKDTPYDYERAWFRVARPLADRPGHCLVFDVGLQFNHLPYGDRPMARWFVETDEPVFVMLEQNLPPR